AQLVRDIGQQPLWLVIIRSRASPIWLNLRQRLKTPAQLVRDIGQQPLWLVIIRSRASPIWLNLRQRL
ncbi:hypothetical protein C7D71_31300, partial [Klebsiella pneumoniae]